MAKQGLDNSVSAGSDYDDVLRTGRNLSVEPLALSGDHDIKDTPARIKWSIWKNVILVSLSFLCLFSAFQSLSNLQSSINADHNLGTISLTTIYLALLVSCLLLPSLVLNRLTCKWAMVGCIFCYSFYMMAQFYPRYFTVIPGAIVLGLGAAPLWAAKCTYLTQISAVYSRVSRQPFEPVIVRFFGVFFLLFQFSQILGNIASSVLLLPGDEHRVDSGNLSLLCGVNFCNGNLTVVSNPNLERPADPQLLILNAVFVALSVFAGFIIALFVDGLDRYQVGSCGGHSVDDFGPVQLFSATLYHLKNPYQVLIIPLTMWSGFEQAFITASFTKGFVACTSGVHSIGLVMIVYGLTDSLGSLTLGFLIRKSGRIPIFISGALINYTVMVLMMVWVPSSEQFYMFLVLGAAWGCSDAVWQTQINSLYGVLFPQNPEAAFSNYRMWESLGFAIQFAYADRLCVDAKLIILLAVLSLGMFGYLLIEIFEYRDKNSDSRGSIEED